MNYSDFVARIKRIEASGKRQDRRFRLRLAIWMVAGYLYLGAVCAALAVLPWIILPNLPRGLAPDVLIVQAAMLLILTHGMSMLISLCKAFKASSDQHDDTRRRVYRREAPALFEMIDTIAHRLKAPRLTAVYIGRNHNAGIRQVRRAGWLPLSRNELCIGLSFMQTLTAQQFAAVLAHELAHLSQAHGKLGASIHAMHQLWERLEQQMAIHPIWMRGWLHWFLRWYSTRFDAETFMLRRAQEYAADRDAASVIGNAAAAESLCAAVLSRRWLNEEFFNKLMAEARLHPSPVGAPFTMLAAQHGEVTRTAGLADFLSSADTRAIATVWLHQELSAMTDYADTHPCLRERIEALDIDAASLEVPFMAHASAAAVLLGRQEIKLAGELDRQWREDVREEWEKRHAYLTSELAAEYRASLRKKATQLFNAKDWTQLACMRRELGHGLAEYEYSLEHALECDPTYAPSRIMLAQLALERRELEKASFHLEAIRSQEEVAVAYHGISFRIASRKGNIEVARAHLAEHDRELARRWALASEIREITANDCFSPHGLNEFHVGKLRQCLSLLETYLEQAWIVKRTLRGDERQCHWLIVLQPRMSMLTRLLGPLHFLHHPAARLCHDFLEQNELPVPGPYCTYVAEHSSSAVLKALKESLQPGGTEFGIFI